MEEAAARSLLFLEMGTDGFPSLKLRISASGWKGHNRQKKADKKEKLISKYTVAKEVKLMSKQASKLTNKPHNWRVRHFHLPFETTMAV